MGKVNPSTKRAMVNPEITFERGLYANRMQIKKGYN